MGQAPARICLANLKHRTYMGDMNPQDTPIRDAATIILVRDATKRPRVLMGQRGAQAAFLPKKFVFPGGAVDQLDREIAPSAPLSDLCRDWLAEDAAGLTGAALAVAAIRELWEETGLILGAPASWDDAPGEWVTFAERGFRPSADALSFFFRAITPPGRPRRFDARFFLASADALCTDPDDFSAASDELSHLQWVDLRDLRQYDLPFITQVVLAELAAALPDLGPPRSVPFFKNSDEESLFVRLGGAPFTR